MQILLPTSLNTAALPNHLAQLASDRIHALFCLAHLISRRIDPILHQPVCNESVEEEIGEGEKDISRHAKNIQGARNILAYCIRIWYNILVSKTPPVFSLLWPAHLLLRAGKIQGGFLFVSPRPVCGDPPQAMQGKGSRRRAFFLLLFLQKFMNVI